MLQELESGADRLQAVLVQWGSTTSTRRLVRPADRSVTVRPVWAWMGVWWSP